MIQSRSYVSSSFHHITIYDYHLSLDTGSLYIDHLFLFLAQNTTLGAFQMV